MEPAFLSSGGHQTETSYRESGTRSQEPEFSEQNDFPTFSEIILLLLYADK